MIAIEKKDDNRIQTKYVDPSNGIFENFNLCEGVKLIQGQRTKAGPKSLNLLNLSLFQDINNPIKITKTEYNNLIKDGNFSISQENIKKSSSNNNESNYIHQENTFQNESTEKELNINLSKIKIKKNISSIQIKSNKAYDHFLTENMINDYFNKNMV